MKRTLPQLIQHALTVAAVVAVSIFSAHAEGDSVTILAKDGTSFTAKIADVKRIDLGTDEVVLSTESGESATYSYADVDRIMIGATPAGISDITAQGNVAVWPTTVSSTLNIAGAEPGTTVNVYGINGALIATAKATDGTLSIDLSGAPAGVCIVSIGNHSVKIIKK